MSGRIRPRIRSTDTGGVPGPSGTVSDIADASELPARDTADAGTLLYAQDTGVVWRESNGIFVPHSVQGHADLAATHDSVEEEAPDGVPNYTLTAAVGGSAIDYDTSVAGKIAVVSGSAFGLAHMKSPNNKGATDCMAVRLVGVSITGGGGGGGFFNVDASVFSNDGQLALRWDPSVSANNWCVEGTASTIDTGIPIATTPNIMAVWRKRSTVYGHLQIYANDGASPSYEVQEFQIPGAAEPKRAQCVSVHDGAQTFFAFDAFYPIYLA